MQCPNCETENRDDAKFCDECGFPLGGAGARNVAAPSDATAPKAEAYNDSRNSEHALDRESSKLQDDGFERQFDDFDKDVFEDFSDSPSEEGVSSEADAVDEIQSNETQVIEDLAADETQSLGSMRAPEEDRFAGFAKQAEDDYGYVSESAQTSSFYGNYEPQPDHTMQMPRVERDSAPSNRDFRASAPVKRTPKAALVVIAVAAVAVVVAIVTFAFGLWGGVAVPDVTGMTESDARSVLEENGFSVRSTQVKSDDTEGLVLIMDPAGGSRAAEGSEIVIHIATARFVPDIVGKSYDEAVKLLEEAGYENVRYEKVKSADEEDVVLSVSPEAGTRAKSSMEIVVGVSEAYRVPDISGLDLTAAEEAITKGGLIPSVVYVDTQDYPEGTILGTTPEANTKVAEGDYVTINVAQARGAELVSLTQQMFVAGTTATIGGTDFAIDSVDSVEYIGDDTVSFKVTGRPFATLMGETVYGTTQSIEGQVVYSADNEVLSIS